MSFFLLFFFGFAFFFLGAGFFYFPCRQKLLVQTECGWFRLLSFWVRRSSPSGWSIGILASLPFHLAGSGGLLDSESVPGGLLALLPDNFRYFVLGKAQSGKGDNAYLSENLVCFFSYLLFSCSFLSLCGHGGTFPFFCWLAVVEVRWW